MLTSDCPPAVELGLLLDGKAHRSLRTRLASHLNGCRDCRTVVGDSAAYLEELSPRAESDSMWERITGRLRVPTFIASGASGTFGPFGLAILFGAIAVAVPMLWLANPYVDMPEYSSTVAAVSLASDGSVDIAANLWRFDDGGLAFGGALTGPKRAFRIGVRLVDARSLLGGTPEITRSVLEELDELARSDSPLSVSLAPLSSSTVSAQASGLDAFENEVRAVLDEAFIDLGIWSESARLATVGAPSFFEGSAFTSPLQEFHDRDFPEATKTKLTTIARLAQNAASPQAMSDLRRALRDLILLNE